MKATLLKKITTHRHIEDHVFLKQLRTTPWREPFGPLRKKHCSSRKVDQAEGGLIKARAKKMGAFLPNHGNKCCFDLNMLLDLCLHLVLLLKTI